MINFMKYESIYHFFLYIKFHKQLPKKNRTLTGLMYHIRSSDILSDPLRITVTDKEYAKKFISDKIGNSHVVPTIKVLHSVKSNFFNNLPSQYVIKATHSSGLVFLKRNNTDLIDLDKIKSWLDENYYKVTREKNYKDLIPKLIIEDYIFPNHSNVDYKFWCWNGEVKLIQVDIDRFAHHRRSFFDVSLKIMKIDTGFLEADINLKQINNIYKMKNAANKLASYFSGYIRIDMYSNGDHFYIGELTNHADGAAKKYNKNDDEYLYNILTN